MTNSIAKATEGIRNATLRLNWAQANDLPDAVKAAEWEIDQWKQVLDGCDEEEAAS